MPDHAQKPRPPPPGARCQSRGRSPPGLVGDRFFERGMRGEGRGVSRMDANEKILVPKFTRFPRQCPCGRCWYERALFMFCLVYLGIDPGDEAINVEFKVQWPKGTPGYAGEL